MGRDFERLGFCWAWTLIFWNYLLNLSNYDGNFKNSSGMLYKLDFILFTVSSGKQDVLKSKLEGKKSILYSRSSNFYVGIRQFIFKFLVLYSRSSYNKGRIVFLRIRDTLYVCFIINIIFCSNSKYEIKNYQNICWILKRRQTNFLGHRKYSLQKQCSYRWCWLLWTLFLK